MTSHGQAIFRYMLIFGVLLATDAALAKNDGKLPKGAVPLSAEETKALLAGNSINWGAAQIYWAPNGSLVGHYKKGKDESFAEGKWTVNGNEMCEDNIWHGKDKSKPLQEGTCKKFYKLGKIIWTENTKDQEKYQGDFWDGIDKRIKKGDIASKKAQAVKLKFGY
jgi:Protein of unknown function (DUF995)